MIILPEDKNIISLLSPEDSKTLLLALFSNGDDIPELNPLVNMAYTAIRSKSDRISEKKSRAGKTGGAPKNNLNAKKQSEQSKQAEQAEQADARKTTLRTTTVPLPLPKPNTVAVDVDKSAREEEPFDNYAYDKFGLPPMTEEDIVFEDVSIECAQSGIVISGARNEAELDRLIGQYTATWVKEAAKRIADKPPEKRHLGMLKAILKAWGDQGHIDVPGHQSKPVSTPGLRM